MPAEKSKRVKPQQQLPTKIASWPLRISGGGFTPPTLKLVCSALDTLEISFLCLSCVPHAGQRGRLAKALPLYSRADCDSTVLERYD